VNDERCGHCGVVLRQTRQRLRWTKADKTTVQMCPDCFEALVLSRAAEARPQEQKS
jgi:hypothetical protein